MNVISNDVKTQNTIMHCLNSIKIYVNNASFKFVNNPLKVIKPLIDNQSWSTLYGKVLMCNPEYVNDKSKLLARKQDLYTYINTLQYDIIKLMEKKKIEDNANGKY